MVKIKEKPAAGLVILPLAYLIYTTVYLCRVNLSMASAKLISEEVITNVGYGY